MEKWAVTVACFAGGLLVSVILYFLKPSIPLLVGSLSVIYICFAFATWFSPWIKDKFRRRIIALFVVAGILTTIGYYIRPIESVTEKVPRYAAKTLPLEQPKQPTVKIVEEPSINERFALSIVLDRESGKMVSIYPFGPGKAKDLFFNDAVSRSNGLFVADKHTFFSNLRPPIPANDIVGFYEELIQYQLISWLVHATRGMDAGYLAIGVNEAISGIILHVPLLPPNYVRMPGKKVLAALSKNRFVDEKVRNDWDNPVGWLPMPPHAMFSMPDRQSIVIERPKYFKITFMVNPGPVRSGGVPKHLLEAVTRAVAEGLIKPGALKLDPKTGEGLVKLSDLETLWFIVNLTATFEGLSMGSKEATDMKKWVTALFAECKQLADPEE
jgi:hypothetical protein